jgi:hypothetical protein
MVSALAPSPPSASAFYRMHITLLVIKAFIPAESPCPRPCNRMDYFIHSMDYFIDSHDFT